MRSARFLVVALVTSAWMFFLPNAGEARVIKGKTISSIPKLTVSAVSTRGLSVTVPVTVTKKVSTPSGVVYTGNFAMGVRTGRKVMIVFNQVRATGAKAKTVVAFPTKIPTHPYSNQFKVTDPPVIGGAPDINLGAIKVGATPLAKSQFNPLDNVDSDDDGISDLDDHDDDNDGTPDDVDTDEDGNGVIDHKEDMDADHDGKPNCVDDDDDNDGVKDSKDRDDDGNGVRDWDGDRDADDDGVKDRSDLDSDNDGNLNRNDRDKDGDDSLDSRENDSDKDGLPDDIDTDDDNDGIMDWSDSDNDNDGVPDRLERDRDHDGEPDDCDADDDGDGINDDKDPTP